MKLTIFGATGGVGTQLVRQARAQGHEVTVVVRDRAKITEAGVRVMEAQVTTEASQHDATPARAAGVEVRRLEDAAAGADAVLSAIGPRNRAHAGVATEATRNILRAMTATGVSRISVVSAAPVDGPSPQDDLITRRAVVPLLGRFYRDVYTDLRNMEDSLRNSDTVWTAVRPPKLTNGRHRGSYRTHLGGQVPRGMFISRADVADALLTSLITKEHERAVVGIAY